MTRTVTPKGVQKAIDAGDVEAVKRCLTHRQLRFCEEYAIDYSGPAAARRAGYSPKGIETAAQLLLKHEGVRYYIQDLMKSTAAKIMSVDPDYVISRIVAIINEDGSKNGDKLRGLELLARHLGMLTDKQEITGKDGGAIEIDQRTSEDANTFVTVLKALVAKNEKASAAPDKTVTYEIKAPD